jgi:hypothetical protein
VQIGGISATPVKNLFAVWKKQTQIIDLKSLYSDKFCTSSKFRERIYRLVENAQEQLVLNFNRSGSFGRLINLNCCNQTGVGAIVEGCSFNSLPCFPLDYPSLSSGTVSFRTPSSSSSSFSIQLVKLRKFAFYGYEQTEYH